MQYSDYFRPRKRTSVVANPQASFVRVSDPDHDAMFADPQASSPNRSAPYNAAADLLQRNLIDDERKAKVAVIDESGSFTYEELAERVARCAGLLLHSGIRPEERIVLCLLDTIDFPTCFLGAIQAGIVPIPLNTLLTAQDYGRILADSQPRAAIVSQSLLSVFQEAARLAEWTGTILISGEAGDNSALHDRLLSTEPRTEVAATRADSVCFWLYSSGSTGKPKGVVHRHASLMATATLFGQGVLGMNASDVVYSAAKLFFAYGLGNSLSFPMSVGATSIFFSGRATPAAVNGILRERGPTLFFGVPTLFGAMLSSPDLPASGQHNLRFAVSAGEALPERIGRAFVERTGVDIVDGIGSTEMLHVFVSNRPGCVRYGTTGRTVPGYQVRLLDESGAGVGPGDMGEMQVSGPSAANGYWNDDYRTRATFVGDWVRTGDKFRQTPEGEFVHCGRSDEMLKVSGIWVSPQEVESALCAHEAVSEAAVVGALDEAGLVKPKAFVVLKPAVTAEPALARAIQQFVKGRLAPYKYPRWVEFIEALPKTATGKIQLHLLRN
jgi:benzoate-CoA ligase